MGLSTDEVIEIVSIYLILPATLDTGVCSASDRNEYQKQKKMFLGSRVWPGMSFDHHL
jgi:hypothetical protein